MNSVRLLIDGTAFRLSPDENVPDVKQRFLDGATEAPRYVTFSTSSGEVVTALVTLRTRIRFEVEPPPAMETYPSPAEAISVDFLDWLEDPSSI